MSSYEYITPQDAYYRAVNPNKPTIKGLRGGPAYWVNGNLGSAEVERTATQDNGKAYDFSLKTIEDVVPGMHAYRLVYTEGGYDELTSYDKVCVMTPSGPEGE